MEDIKGLKPMESGGIDFNEFEGTKATIEILEIKEVSSQFSETGKAKVLKVQTEPITTLKDSAGNDIEIRASEILQLKEKDGQLGFSTSPKSKMYRLLKKLKVNSPAELKGKSVIVKVRTSKGPDGQERDFLGFYME